MSFPVLSFPYDCATSTDLTVRHGPVTVCDINRSRCAACSDLCNITEAHYLRSVHFVFAKFSLLVYFYVSCY